MITNKKILITGGGGFIGTALAEKLAKQNEVVLLDRNFDRNSFAFSKLKSNKDVRLVEADILDTQEVASVTQGAQVVVHTAAVLGVQEVLHNTSYTLDVNYTGTSNLLKAVSSNSGCERVIYLSTSEIFGDTAFRATENGQAVLSSIQDARWCYCISKLAAEQLAFGYFREKGLPVVVVRPFNIFGPGRIGDHVMLRFILNALRNKNLKVYGDGTQIRAWCYIDDLCNALLQCIEVEEAVGQAFNIGNSRNTLTIYDLAKKVVSLCGSKSQIVFKALDFMDIDIRVPNISKARDVLGFTPEIELEEGLSRTIEWLKRHADEISSLISTESRESIT